jgi:DNA invertase Pin-like site-specific DNA recombinase
VSSTKDLIKRKLDFLDELNKNDILICTETSRLSRSLLELLTLVDELLRKGVRLIFVMQGLVLVDLSNLNTKIALHMFSVMAEHERSVLSQRTKEALRILKERGIKLGKPKGSIQHSIFDKYKDKIKEWCRLGLSYPRQAKLIRLSANGLRRYVKTRKIYVNPLLKRYPKA